LIQAELSQAVNNYEVTLRFYAKPQIDKRPFPGCRFWDWQFTIFASVGYGGIEAPRVIEVEPGNSARLDDREFEFVSDRLEQVLLELEPKSKTMATALREQAKLYRVEENNIYFVTSEWMKARFDKPQPRTAIHEAFNRVLGHPVGLYFVADDDPNQALILAAMELGGRLVE
jgi:hypothetical protein